MFSRGKDKKKPVANQLSGGAEPNSLSWSAAGADTGADTDADAGEIVELEGEDEEFEDEEFEDEEADERSEEERAADLQAELQRQAEEFGLTKLDPKDIYGPNGEDVESVLSALERINLRQAAKLADAWESVDSAERAIVETVVRRHHLRSEFRTEMGVAEGRIETWLQSHEHPDDDEGDEDAEILRIAASAARDAVHALILDEELDDADFDTLYGPWYEVMDAPSEDGADEADEESGGADEGDEGDDGDDETEDEDDGEEAVGDLESDAGTEDGPFGPNTGLVQDLLERLRNLSQDELNRLEKVWSAGDREGLRDAHRDLDQATKEDRDWRDQVRRAQDKIVAWASLRPQRQHVVPPLADCVAALVMADILEPENAEMLYAPWAEVVGEPLLPTFADEGDAEGE